MERVAMIREHVPDVALTTDIIVGFPGETEEDFAQTLEVAEEVRYDAAFTFVFSPRRGTEAAADRRGPGGASREGRAHAAPAGGRPAQRARERAQRFVGRTLEVLVEGASRTDRRAPARAHAPQQSRQLLGARHAGRDRRTCASTRRPARRSRARSCCSRASAPESAAHGEHRDKPARRRCAGRVRSDEAHAVAPAALGAVERGVGALKTSA